MKTFVFRNRKVRLGLFFGISGGLFCFFVFSYFLMPSFIGLAWNGYYTVLLDAEVDSRKAVSLLEAEGVEGVLSSANATVEFSDFDRTEVSALGDLPKRLVPEDPRYDSFLKRAPSLFSSASGREHVLYVPARMSPFSLSVKLGKAFRGLSWSSVDWQLGRRVVFLGVFALIAGLMAFRSRGKRLLAPVFALPWLNFLVHGSPTGFAAACLLYVGFVLLLEAAWIVFEHVLHYGALHEIGGLKDRAAYLAIIAVAAVFLVLYPEGELAALVPLLFGAGGVVSLFGLIVAYSAHRKDRREHRLFIPVSILPRRWRNPWRTADRYRRFALVAVFVLILVAPSAGRLTDSDGMEVIPKPSPVSGLHALSRENLKALWMLRGNDTPPDLADYLCHRALQDGFLYGSTWGFPSADSKITLSRFSEKDGTLQKTPEAVVLYDEAWYKEVLKSSKRTGLGDLLHRQGCRDVTMQPAGKLESESPFLNAAVTVFAFLPLLFAGFGFAPVFSSDERGFGLRRKQQEA